MVPMARDDHVSAQQRISRTGADIGSSQNSNGMEGAQSNGCSLRFLCLDSSKTTPYAPQIVFTGGVCEVDSADGGNVNRFLILSIRATRASVERLPQAAERVLDQ